MTTTTEDGVPVFGADAPLEDTVEFAVEAMHVPTGERIRHHFTAWRDPGAGPVLSFIRAAGDAQMNAAARLIWHALVDDDGLPESYRPMPGEDRDARLDDVEQWSSRRRFTRLVESPDDRIAGAVLEQLADWIARAALTRGGTPAGDAVPTAAPSPSRAGRTTKRRGSAAKRSGTASA
jgi:hypothetical protein